MSAHAELSPSSAARWSVCTASVSAQRGIFDGGSAAARWGTAAHLVASEALSGGKQADFYLGKSLVFGITPDGARRELFVDGFTGCFQTVEHILRIDQDIVDCAHAYVEFVRDLVVTSGARMLVEQRVGIGHITGEAGAGGTADTILLTDDEIYIIDLKGGMGKVFAYETLAVAKKDPITGVDMPAVYEPNKQLAMYAGGAVYEHRLLQDFSRVTMVIVQPRLNHVSQYTMPVAELELFLTGISEAAERTRTDPVFAPSFDACHFCKAKGSCSAQTEAVLTTVLDGFDDIDEAKTKAYPQHEVGSLYAKVSMIKDWCTAIEERVHESLLQGHTVSRHDGLSYKLVTGRQGGRDWSDEVAAEASLKKMRLKPAEMYTSKLISPTTAEKYTKVPKATDGGTQTEPLLGKTQWARLQTLITQKQGRPTVVLETDPRPAIVPATDGFQDLTGTQ